VTAPLVLAGYIVVVGTAGAAWLRQAAWPQRSPRLGIFVWQAVGLSVMLAFPLVGIALALPTLPLTTSLADAFRACAVALREQYSTPGGAVVATAGVVLAVGVILRVAYCLTVTALHTRRQRQAQRATLSLVGRRDEFGTWLVDHPAASVYCMPGRRRDIVVTTAAVAALDARQLDAVLAHERAHLDARHDLVLLVAAALRRAFPFLPLFRIAQEQLAVLVEMHADDQALRDSDRRDLATALVSMAEGATPAATFGAGGASALARVRRLATPVAPVSAVRSLVTLGAALSVVMIPLIVMAAPGAMALAIDYCPVSFPA
jgi:Zn-dependent protease with chaperone function